MIAREDAEAPTSEAPTSEAPTSEVNESQPEPVVETTGAATDAAEPPPADSTGVDGATATRRSLATPAPSGPRMRPLHEARVRLAVLVTACLLFLPNLGAFGLWDPWETHYGAVTTEMLDTWDWVSPWWGWRGKLGGEAANEAGGFYSKPILIFWTEAIAARVVGRGEWAVRLPCALLAILAVYVTYLSISRVWTRRTGLLAAAVLATSPFFFMVSRQAQTDMPFVATLTVAMGLFLLATLAPALPIDDRTFRRRTWLTVGALALMALPQYGLMLTDFPAPHAAAVGGFPSGLLHQGWPWALGYTLLFGAILWHARRSYTREVRAAGGLTDDLKDRWNRRYLLWLFYATLAMSSYAKGLLGFLLPGAILFFWLLVTNGWRLLGRVELLRGVGVFLALGLPWYVAMLVKHGQAYFQRFFIHDHFNRAFSGVHQIDSGTFEHFIKWLGFGLFPWVAFTPLALFWLLRLRTRDEAPQNRALVLLATWALFSFALFTYSSTKFHHYIFPAIPPMAAITALFIRWLVHEGGAMARFVTIIAAVTTLAVGTDLAADPQHLRNLMTYKYDRPMPKPLPLDADVPVAEGSKTTWAESTFFRHISPTMQATLTSRAFRFEHVLPWLTAAAVLAVGLFFFARTRLIGVGGLAVVASLLLAWSLNYYLPSLTPHWSQKYLFDAYYDTCTLRPMRDDIRESYEPLLAKVGLGDLADYLRSEPKRICEEDITAWLITWRGETYYSYNELIPIGKREQLPTYLEQFNNGRKFYLIAERGRAQTIRSELKTATDGLKKKRPEAFGDVTEWDVKVENDENHFFQTLSATPVRSAQSKPSGS